jgi:hypothetical protein
MSLNMGYLDEIDASPSDEIPRLRPVPAGLSITSIGSLPTDA